MSTHAPKQLRIFVYTQMWEFFGTFGMTVLLVLYMTHTLGFSDSKAYSVFGGYMALMYGMPILGGIVIDHWLQKRTTVMLGGTLMALGSFLIMVPHTLFLYIALSLSIIGYGLFTPSLIALVGNLSNQKRSLTSSFTLYYVGENIGAFTAPIVCSLVGAHFGWNYGFGIAGIGMLTGLFVFWRGYRPELQVAHPEQRTISPPGSHRVYWIALACLLAIPVLYVVISMQVAGFAMLVAAMLLSYLVLRIGKRANPLGRKHIIGILFMLLFMMLFYTFLSQNGTSFSLFFDRIIDRHLGGYTLPAPMLLSAEPLFMFVWAPILLKITISNDFATSVIWKYIVGLLATSLAFVVLLIAAMEASKTGTASMFYVVLAFFIFPVGELFIVPVGFAIVTRLAPKKDLGVMIGIWTFGQAMARYLAAKLANIASVPSQYLHPFQGKIAAGYYEHTFGIILILAVISAMVLWFIRPFLQRLMQTG